MSKGNRDRQKPIRKYKDQEEACAKFVMTGCFVIIAIIWFFFMAYIYLSWIVLPLFFSHNLQLSNIPKQNDTTGWCLIALQIVLNTMLLLCLMKTWKGSPGFVDESFKSVVASEEVITHV
jgi:hypothetical protein